jgi:hypothetical protein
MILLLLPKTSQLVLLVAAGWGLVDSNRLQASKWDPGFTRLNENLVFFCNIRHMVVVVYIIRCYCLQDTPSENVQVE